MLRRGPPINVETDDAADVTARLADLGEARMLEWSGGAHKERTVDQPRWLAPEVLAATLGYTQASDVYSLGMLLWELYARDEPFAAFSFRFDSQLEDAIIDGLRPALPPATPSAIASLIADAWQDDARRRPTASKMHKALVSIKPTLPEQLIEKKDTAATPLFVASLELPALAISSMKVQKTSRRHRKRSEIKRHGGKSRRNNDDDESLHGRLITQGGSEQSLDLMNFSKKSIDGGRKFFILLFCNSFLLNIGFRSN